MEKDRRYIATLDGAGMLCKGGAAQTLSSLRMVEGAQHRWRVGHSRSSRHVSVQFMIAIPTAILWAVTPLFIRSRYAFLWQPYA